MDRPDLDPLFAPESIAVVGASPDSTYASGVIDTLGYGYGGTIYPVNPGREEVWGRRCYDSITDVPEVVDLVVVNVPREAAIDVVSDAGDAGVPAAIVITAGFGEADERGAELEAELAEAAERGGIRVMGPNCLGFANVHDSTILKAASTPRRPEPGSIALVSQSGALSFSTFFERAADEDVHFAYIVSSGNEADLTTADYVEYLADDPRVDVICTYTEGVDDPRRFMRVADAATRSGTPVLTVKVGRSSRAEAATLSHTGSLVGSDDAWEAAFAQTGVERVPDIPDLLARASAHAAYDPPASNRICAASTSGGLTSLLADMAGQRGLELPDITGETERALLEMEELLTFGEMHNPTDIRGYGASVLPEIADVLLDDDGFDAYVFALGISAVDERADRVADDVLEIAERADDPVFFLWTGRKEPADLEDPQPYERVREEIPLFYDPSRCMDALASLVHGREARDRLSGRPTREALEGGIGEPRVGDLPEGAVLGWRDAERLLSAYGIDLVETRVAADADEAAAAAEALGGPVVVKVDSPDVPHRAEVGGVLTGVDADGARDAYATVTGNVRGNVPGADVEGVLVQPEVPGGVEALVGASTDEAFGPLVTVGSGGTAVEAIDDAAVRVPPLSEADARGAIDETHLARILDDGGEDPGPLAEAAVRAGRLAAEVDAVAELDLNPVIVRDGTATAVDALVRTR